MTEKRTEELVEGCQAPPDGYNCAQSVACALSEEVGVDENICFRLEGFGLGMGQMQETCGAVSEQWLLWAFNSIGTQSPSTKASTYGLVRPGEGTVSSEERFYSLQ